MADNSQKFIGRNRAPRVQIEYEVELYGSEKKIQLPFVMGVMSDLAGKSNADSSEIEDRKFLEINLDNFDDRMQTIRPRATYSVPNTLTGEGELQVDLSFEKLDDFAPAAIADKIEPLQALLQARTELSDLLAYTDGKSGAEDLINSILHDDGMLNKIAQFEVEEPSTDTAFETLRERIPQENSVDNKSSEILDALRSSETTKNYETDLSTSALDALKENAPTVDDEPDRTVDSITTLREAPVSPVIEDDTEKIISNLSPVETEAVKPETTDLEDILEDIGAVELENQAPVGEAHLKDILADLVNEDESNSAISMDVDEILAEIEKPAEEFENSSSPETEQSHPQDEPQENAVVGSKNRMISPDSQILDHHLSTSDSSADDDLETLLAELGADELQEAPEMEVEIASRELIENPEQASASTLTESAHFQFGQLASARLDPNKLGRQRFRIAIMGDFSGRAARRELETGDLLAKRKAVLLDPDTVEDVIEGFSTTLILPIGKDGAGIEVRLDGLDDLHPDELFEKVELFSALKSLKSRLSTGATAESARLELLKWGEQFAKLIAPAQSKSAGNAVPADRKMSDFQRLIGGSAPPMQNASPLDDMLARIVGPHIRREPDADAVAMQKTVDAALSEAMCLILHHPEFQSIESQWRTLDLIARSVETDDTLEVMLYDISAEEIAADLSGDDLSQSGLLQLLASQSSDEEAERGGYSALFGLYTFEETPPHADILGRIAKVSAHIDAPFFGAISPSFFEVKNEDRHALVASAWDSLRSLPEAVYLGIVSPRFLLRRPYGAKSEPIYEFDFEEFTLQSGLSGMLWANPTALVAVLLARSFKLHGRSMELGSVMSLGEIPFHFVDDSYGDQVALPCTERNLTEAKVAMATERGYMPVVSVKGRDEIRLGSFRSLAGSEIQGIWSDNPPPEPHENAVSNSIDEFETNETTSEMTDDPSSDTENDDLELEELLAGFDIETDEDEAEEDIDAELAALLDGL